MVECSSLLGRTTPSVPLPLPAMSTSQLYFYGFLSDPPGQGRLLLGLWSVVILCCCYNDVNVDIWRCNNKRGALTRGNIAVIPTLEQLFHGKSDTHFHSTNGPIKFFICEDRSFQEAETVVWAMTRAGWPRVVRTGMGGSERICELPTSENRYNLVIN